LAWYPGPEAHDWACAAAQRFHDEGLLDAGVRILVHPAMLHGKAFVRDREDVLMGTCNLDAWSLKRFYELDVLVRSRALAAQLDERFLAPAEAASTPGRAVTGALRGSSRRGSQRSRRCSDGARRRWAHGRIPAIAQIALVARKNTLGLRSVTP
jgi:phosphatidylserine/phosphatidylglycerophosphate/cardiolipin synthase-like enzyme